MIPTKEEWNNALEKRHGKELHKVFSSAYKATQIDMYKTGALAVMLDLGAESGPMNHAFDLKGAYAE